METSSISSTNQGTRPSGHRTGRGRRVRAARLPEINTALRISNPAITTSRAT